jgi:endonuclease/exonuclease/phosphatase (EEP) superfamily protein YafD
VWWAFDIAANLRLQLGVLLVVTAVLYWVTVGRGAAILFLAAGIANLVLVLPLWLGSQPPAASDDRLDLVTFNVEREVAARSEILQWLGTVDADLVFLQETTEEWVSAIEDSGIDMEVIAVPQPQSTHGIIVLAATDSTATVSEIGSSKDQLVEVSTSLAGTRVTVFGVHPPSPNNQRDAAARDEVLVELGELVATRSEPVIVVGDLSATRWSNSFREMRQIGGLSDSEDGFGFQGTWPASTVPVIRYLISIPIDHVLTTRSLTTPERAMGPRIASSHLPLLVEVALAGT